MRRGGPGLEPKTRRRESGGSLSSVIPDSDRESRGWEGPFVLRLSKYERGAKVFKEGSNHLRTNMLELSIRTSYANQEYSFKELQALH